MIHNVCGSTLVMTCRFESRQRRKSVGTGVIRVFVAFDWREFGPGVSVILTSSNYLTLLTQVPTGLRRRINDCVALQSRNWNCAGCAAWVRVFDDGTEQRLVDHSGQKVQHTKVSLRLQLSACVGAVGDLFASTTSQSPSSILRPPAPTRRRTQLHTIHYDTLHERKCFPNPTNPATNNQNHTHARR